MEPKRQLFNDIWAFYKAHIGIISDGDWERGQFYRRRTDGIHRVRHQLRYVGSTLRHSPGQQTELLPEKGHGAEAYAAEDGALGGREEWAICDCMGKGGLKILSFYAQKLAQIHWLSAL